MVICRTRQSDKISAGTLLINKKKIELMTVNTATNVPVTVDGESVKD